jgi:hypothetical protein
MSKQDLKQELEELQGSEALQMTSELVSPLAAHEQNIGEMVIKNEADMDTSSCSGVI